VAFSVDFSADKLSIYRVSFKVCLQVVAQYLLKQTSTSLSSVPVMPVLKRQLPLHVQARLLE